jgi:hypothetical protein
MKHGKILKELNKLNKLLFWSAIHTLDKSKSLVMSLKRLGAKMN